MKKFISFIVAVSPLCLATLAFAAPTPPVLTLETNGLNVTISWTEVTGASGYKLYYAPYPFDGPQTIGSVDVGNKTTQSYHLWKNAAFLIGVKAYGSGESDYSNIEHFVMGPPSPEWVDNDGDGFIEIDGDCNDSDPIISPIADEICGDEIDQDCSGADLDCPDLLGAPVLSYASSGLNVTISWTEVAGASGYKLYYASAPYSGPQDFSSVNVANQTSMSFALWEGADYHVAVTTYDDAGESVYSNIEHLIIHNSAPVASAGSDQNVVTGELVILRGGGADDDDDPLSYNWQFVSVPTGSSATLSNSNTKRPTFTADVDGEYRLNLTVNDGTVNSAIDSVLIVAQAQALQIGQEYLGADGITVTLDNLVVEEKTGSFQYKINYTLKNNTADQQIVEGTFKLYFTDGTGANQYGFFDNLFPGDSTSRTYTFEELKSKTPTAVGYHHDHFFSATPPEGSLLWNITAP